MLIRFKNFFTKPVSPASILVSPTNEILLWPDTPNGSGEKMNKEKIRMTGGLRVVSNIHHPTILPYLPGTEKNTGSAIIIAPGGGHSELWIDHEGHHPAQWLCERGIAAFVLQYRLANEPRSEYTVNEHALADMRRAIRLVRNHAKEWKIETNRIGVMGFSAGGEIAALTATQNHSGKEKMIDAIDQQSPFPDFQALIYPVGIRTLDITKYSPPLFLLAGFNDDPGIIEDMLGLFHKYKKAGIPAELHMYAHTGHGFGMRKNDLGAIASWPTRLQDWLADCGFLKNI